MAYDAAEWHDFYVMTGGAAAALTGLLFVAMSLHANAIMGNLFYRNRAIGTLMSLTTQLLLAASVLIPGQPLALLGAQVEAAALFWVGMFIRSLSSRGPAAGSVSISPVRRTFEIAGGVSWNVLFVAAGLSLLTKVGGGFYVLALVMVFAFGWNIYVAWVLITEVSE